MTLSVEALAELIRKAEKDEAVLPPVDQWQPTLSGDMDMRIQRDGRWFYLGSEIKRERLVNLFSTILRKEKEDYFLVTPVEKWRIEVEDAPFLATTVARVEGQEGADLTSTSLVFTTNVATTVVADVNHPLRVEVDPHSGEPRPYLLVRSNLEALVSRSAFYQLVEWAEPTLDGELVLFSGGARFSLGFI